MTGGLAGVVLVSEVGVLAPVASFLTCLSSPSPEKELRALTSGFINEGMCRCMIRGCDDRLGLSARGRICSNKFLLYLWKPKIIISTGLSNARRTFYFRKESNTR
uniref:Secreted protein n=1 Tax=Arundo donax TaxID=35708 RepID=A0A0A9EXI8_ARUDO